MSNFDLFHPALQHHIVNSLGWRELRDFQDALIPEVLGGKHLIVLAPTAGGKTEAAFLPTLSRMLTEDWDPLSVLYICPIKALLNNLDTRLERYCDLVGRRSALWHGDVGASARKKLLADPPDCLLTTPESIEVMLVSATIDASHWFRNVRAVIIDEVHAFAGDDRGWHLLAVLERVSKLAGREIQRIGLSATVGNPDQLLGWIAGATDGDRAVAKPAVSGPDDDADVTVDFVGSLGNAATVISRLHRGEKRLVFIDSRARAEQLAVALRQHEVDTYITHSSLSQDQRRQAELAFAEKSNCVIVATSVLELGIDVGDLDRVIQIDAPRTVSSLLQRMGRTGRRSGASRNCLFLCTKEETLLQAAALVELWESGYVEPVTPPPAPLHVLAQQLMALVLQLRGVASDEWFDWVKRMPAFQSLDEGTVAKIVQWMLEHDLLWQDSGLISIGQAGEEAYGQKHFLELLSVFTSPPEFEVLHGRRQLGYVDQQTFTEKSEGPRLLSLGGQAWKVNHVDWGRRRAYVEPVQHRASSRWRGGGDAGLSFALCRAVRGVLTASGGSRRWSKRAGEQLDEARYEYAWLTPTGTTAVVGSDGGIEWWTFAGRRANAALAAQLEIETAASVRATDHYLTVAPSATAEAVEAAIVKVGTLDPQRLLPEVNQEAVEALKFSECLPPTLGAAMLQSRSQDVAAVAAVQAERVTFSVQRTV